MRRAAKTHDTHQKGFTLVELLIVIVVIGILAALVVVAYGGITAQAHKAKRLADVNSIQKALELYRQDNGYYPANGTDNWGGPLNSAGMENALGTYLRGGIPREPSGDPSKAYQYVRGTADNYGIRIFWSDTVLPGCHWTDTSPCRFCKIGKDLDVGTNQAGGVYASWYTTVGCPGYKSGYNY